METLKNVSMFLLVQQKKRYNILAKKMIKQIWSNYIYVKVNKQDVLNLF